MKQTVRSIGYDQQHLYSAQSHKRATMTSEERKRKTKADHTRIQPYFGVLERHVRVTQRTLTWSRAWAYASASPIGYIMHEKDGNRVTHEPWDCHDKPQSNRVESTRLQVQTFSNLLIYADKFMINMTWDFVLISFAARLFTLWTKTWCFMNIWAL